MDPGRLRLRRMSSPACGRLGGAILKKLPKKALSSQPLSGISVSNWRVCARPERAPEDSSVPKLKSHRGARKRFKLTGSGKVKRSHSLKNHILTKKTTKRKRHLRKSALVSPTMERGIRAMISV